jgi:hypothetical protein
MTPGVRSDLNVSRISHVRGELSWTIVPLWQGLLCLEYYDCLDYYYSVCTRGTLSISIAVSIDGRGKKKVNDLRTSDMKIQLILRFPSRLPLSAAQLATSLGGLLQIRISLFHPRIAL